jgi:hypothetical protein
MTKRIEAYSLFEFCQAVQEAVQEGYVFDFQTSENFPTAFGSLLVAGMVQPTKQQKVQEEPKEQVTEVTETETEVQTEIEDAVDEPVAKKRGPKAKQ